MRDGNETMPKNTMQLNPDKVALRIAEAGKPIKAHASDDLSEKTIHRMKKGGATSVTKAHLLAAALTRPSTTCSSRLDVKRWNGSCHATSFTRALHRPGSYAAISPRSSPSAVATTATLSIGLPRAGKIRSTRC
jgi:hypothetical protein